MDRHERLTALLKYLNDNGDKEYNFESIYQKLLTEFDTEYSYNSNMRENMYLNHLRQTRDTQAARYIEIKQKRTKKSCYSEFDAFVRNFKQDIFVGLRINFIPETNITSENDEE